MKKTIAVFCGREYGPHKEKYQKIALEMGRLLAENGFTLATGGGPGMMSDVNRGAFEAGGKVISVQFGFSDGNQSPYFTEKHHYEDLRERQKFLIELADGTIVLPGGIGTLYEAVEIISLKRIGAILLELPLIFVGDYYRHMESFLRLQESEGFLPIKVDSSCDFASTAQDAIMKLNTLFKR